MSYFLRFVILIIIIFNTSVSLRSFGNDLESDSYNTDNENFLNVFAPGDTITGTVTGTTSVCLNGTRPVITFTGKNGKAPYTFVYKINDGAENTKQTVIGKDTIMIKAPTDVAGVFKYTLVKVKDAPDTSFFKDNLSEIIITVNPPPIANFSFTNDNACSGTIIQFTSTSTGAEPLKYIWEFGDKETSTVQNPTHSFTSLGCDIGKFKIKLTITDANGCISSVEKEIIVKQKPDIGFTDLKNPYDPFSNCGNASFSNPNFNVEVKNISKSSCITSYSLDWGDGSSIENNVTFPIPHTYSRLGAFNLVITAKGNNGCDNSITYIVKNVTNPSVGVTSPGTTANLCAPTEELKFEIAKWGSNSPGTTYEVDYGDKTPKITFKQEELIKTSYYNNSNPAASANFPIPHSYNVSSCPNKEFIVTVKASNACDTTTATVDNISVLSKPEPDFTFSTSCINSTVLFSNITKQGYNPNCKTGSDYTWNFGDGSLPVKNTGNDPENVTHIYTTSGKYDITLTTKNFCGESSKMSQITINPLPTATISGGATVCQNSTPPKITFTGANGTAPYTFTYRINNVPNTVKTAVGNNSVTVDAPTKTSGTFTYTLVSVQESSAGCSQLQTGEVKIIVNPSPTAKISGTTNTCLNDASPLITFTGSNGTPPYTFFYNINGINETSVTSSGGSSSVTVPVPTDKVDVFKYNLVKVQDASVSACTQTVSETATITIKQPPAEMTLSDYEFCNGETANVKPFANTVAGTTYTWNNNPPTIGLGASGTGNIPSFTAKNGTSNPITATIIVTPRANGCDGKSQTFTITVLPSAAVDFSLAGQTICSGEITQEVQLSSASAGATLSWSAIQPIGISGVATNGTTTIPPQTLINSTNAPITVTYKAKATISGATTCAGTEYNYYITVNPRPEIGMNYKDTICSNSTFSIVPKDGGANKIPVGTKYTWGTPVINPLNAITDGKEQLTPQVSIGQTLVNTTDAVATATYSVTPVFGNCKGNPFEVVISVNPLPKATLSADITTVCVNDPQPVITFTGSNGTAPYIFTYNDGTTKIIKTDAGKNSVTLSAPTDKARTITYTLVSVQESSPTACLQTQNGEVKITINPKPTATISGTATVCLNNPSPLVTFTGSNGTPPYTFTYNINGEKETSVTSSDNSNSITVSAPTNEVGIFNYNLLKVNDASLNACTQTQTGTATITVNQPPAEMILDNLEFCNGVPTDTIKFKNTVTGTTYEWYNSKTDIGLDAKGTGDILPFIATNDKSPNPITATIKVSTIANQCNGKDQTFTITVHPSAKVDFSPANQTICTGESSAEVKLSSTTPGVEITWSAVVPAGISGVEPGGTTVIPPQTLTNNTDAPITIIYKAKAKLSGATTCKDTEFDYKITVNPRPEIGMNYKDTICSNTSFSILPKNGGTNKIPIGTKFKWGMPVYNPTTAITGGSAQTTAQTEIGQTLVNTSSAIATATYSVTPVFENCEGKPFEIIVYVSPQPVVNPINDIPLCNNETSKEITFTGSVTGAYYKWTPSNTNIGIDNSGVDKIAPFTAKNIGTAPVDATITVTPFYAIGSIVCEGKPVQFTITVNPEAKMDNPGNQTTCHGINTTIVFTTKNTGGTTTYAWTSSNPNLGLSETGNGNIVFIPKNERNSVETTNIEVTPTYSNNGISCTGKPIQFTISVYPNVVMDKPNDQTLCNGYFTDTIKFTGNVPETEYKWKIDDTTIGLDPPQGKGDIAPFQVKNDGSTPVVATITVTPSVNGCVGEQKSFTITVNPSPSITEEPVSSTICLGDTPNQLSVSYKNGVGTPTLQWFSNTSNSTSGGTELKNETNTTFNPPSLPAGTMFYYCVITFPTGGCNILTTQIARVTINQYPIISTINLEMSSGETFKVEPKTSNEDIVPPGTTYTWPDPVVSPPGAIKEVLSGQQNQPFISQKLTNNTKAVATVVYKVTPTSENCKGPEFLIIVKVNPPLNPNAVVTPISCYNANDGKIETKIEGGAPFPNNTYKTIWTGPDGFKETSANIYNLKPGFYCLEITDALGMISNTCYTITEPKEINITTDSEKDITCYGAANGEIAISVTGGTGVYKYTWTKDGDSIAATEDIKNLGPGFYEVAVTDANNCGPANGSFTITEPDSLTIKIVEITNVKCFGDSTGAVLVDVQGGTQIELSPGIFGYKYRWTKSGVVISSDKNIANLPAGEYILSVTDSSGCSQKFQVEIKQSEQIAIQVIQTPITCFGDNNATIELIISGGVPPYQADWKDHGGGFFRKNLSAGDYTIIVTDSFKCQMPITVTIKEADIFTISPVVKHISCNGANDGSIALNFVGGKPPILFSWADGSPSGTTRNNLGPGTYNVIIREGGGCSIDSTFEILEPQPFFMSGKITDAFDCTSENTGAIDLFVTGGTTPYDFFWEPDGQKTEDLKNIKAGVYRVTVTDSVGCKYSARFVVNRPLPIEIDVTQTIKYDCTNKKASVLCKAIVKGGVPPYQYKWSAGTPDTLNIMEFDQSGMITLEVTDKRGCIATYAFNVFIPFIGLENKVLNCNQHEYQFNAAVPVENEKYIYEWLIDGVKISDIKNPKHSFNKPGIYKVQLNVINVSTSCTSNYEQFVIVESLPEIALDKEPKFCQGESVVLHATGTDEYRWSTGANADSIIINKTGNYHVIGYSKAGCTDSINFIASNYELLGFRIEKDVDNVTKDQNIVHFKTENVGFSSYHWNFGDKQEAFASEVYHTYEITNDGYFNVNLNVINPNGCLEMDSVKIRIDLTTIPNTFTPNGDGNNDFYLEGWNKKIFNRNGILMFEGIERWDGNYKGKPVANDTYFVIVYDSTETGSTYRTSYVTVLR